MKLFEYIITSWNNLSRNKVRTCLTMLGIVVSISVVITIISIGNRVNQLTGEFFLERTEGSSYLISITDAVSPRNTVGLTYDELSDFQNGFTGVESGICLSSKYDYTGSVVSNVIEDTGLVNISGISPYYSVAKHIKLVCGRFITDEDCQKNSSSVVISDKTAILLFGDCENALGKTIVINSEDYLMVPYVVVGVYKYQSSLSVMGDVANKSTNMFCAYSYLNNIAGASNSTINDIVVYVNVSSFTDMEQAVSYANNFLENLELKFGISRMLDDVTSEVLNAINYITYGFTAISTIALIVGGIVLMNTLLICVTERTKEIGILKALGAPSYSILIQFLCESLMICFIACLLGVFLAFVLLSVLNQSIDTIINLVSITELQEFLRDSDMSFSITKNSVIVSVVFSICVGIIFGLYPAKKGADMQPIDALRYE